MVLLTSDAIKLGADTIDKIYLGSDVVYSGSGTKFATADLTSTSALDVRNILFEMEVTSITEPTFDYVTGGDFVVTEISAGIWQLLSTDEITTFKFDHLNANNRDNITAILIKDGATLTTMLNMNYRMYSLESFVFEDEFNATNVSGFFQECISLISYANGDLSNVTDFSYMFAGTTALTHIADMNTSSGILFNNMFEASGISVIPTFDLSQGTSFDGMFSFSAITYLPVLNTTAGLTFSSMFHTASLLECIGGIDTRNYTTTHKMFASCEALENPTLAEQTTIYAGALYVNSNPCPIQTDAPPIYLLTEPLGGALGQYWVENSSASGDIFDGLLEHTGDSDPEGTPWSPINNLELYYPEDGTINLIVQGNGTRQINTQWVAPADEEWVMSGIYNVVLGASYDMYAIHYNGDNTCDIYLGSNTVPIALAYSGVSYTPPTGTWKIYNEPPSIITDMSEIIYNMDTFNP